LVGLMADARERIYEATLDLITSIGYEAVDADEIARRAGIEREEFDSMFPSKEACAIAVFDQFLADFVATARAAYESEAVWPDSLRAAAYAVAEWMLAHPREVRFGTVEMLWGGEMAQAKREAGFQVFVELVDGGRERAADPTAVPAFTAEGVIGSMAEMMTKRLQKKGEIAEPQEFIAPMMYLAVLPYLGEEAAARELTMPPPRLPRSE
jgi:AcrR family transcriptional regulator